MIESLAVGLDHFRAEILRKTMASDFLRRIFCDRSERLFALFLVSFFLSLTLSIAFPLWVLALGPLIYGIPHLFSSLRFSHYTLSPTEHHQPQLTKRKALFAFFGIMAVLSVYRLIVTFGLMQFDPSRLSEWKGASGGELLAVILTVVIGAVTYQKSLVKGLLGILILVPFFAALILKPYVTIGILVLLHNFVGFAYWYLASKTVAERKVAASSLFITLLVTWAIFAGWFDWAISALNPSDDLSFAHLSFAGLGRMIFPWSENPQTWVHASIVYAFGQGVHYYVWLKAIPDQHHSNVIPTSFRQSLRLMERDFGIILTKFAIGLSILGIGSWLFLNFYQARVTYFCLASYHGYLEIAGLALFFAFQSNHQRVFLRHSEAMSRS